MALKKTLYSLLLGSAALAAPALAQSLIAPSGGWQVTRMEQKTSGPFCALTQGYKNGMIVTLGRNMTEEYSLAVDFQKNKLDPEKSYTVTLRPGPGQTRSMELMPISEVGLLGRFNLENICMAISAAWEYTQDVEAIRRAVRSFKGLPHHLEIVPSKLQKLKSSFVP